MNEDVQDVQQVEATTEASSAENQTSETTQETTQEDSSSTSKTVPYDRFQEVINSKNELKAEIDQIKSQIAQREPEASKAPENPQEEIIKKQLNTYLKDLGYVSKQELEQKEADRQLEQSIKDLEGRYNGKDGRPKFEKTKILEFANSKMIGDLEAAYKLMNEAALTDFAIKQALGKTKGVISEKSDGSGSSQIGSAQSDLLKAAQGGDEEAIDALIRRAL